MSLVKFLVILAVGTLLSWIAWVMVIATIDPNSGPMALALFSLSFFLGFGGLMTILTFFFRHWLEKSRVPFEQIGVASRQSLLLSAGATVALMLQAGRLLSLWSGLVLLAIVILTELFFLTGSAARSRSSSS